jgi:hypothetical protein
MLEAAIHGAITQKTAIFVLTTVRTSDLTITATAYEILDNFYDAYFTLMFHMTN